MRAQSCRETLRQRLQEASHGLSQGGLGFRVIIGFLQRVLIKGSLRVTIMPQPEGFLFFESFVAKEQPEPPRASKIP